MMAESKVKGSKDYIYEDIGEGSSITREYEMVRKRDFDQVKNVDYEKSFLQSNSAYGVVDNGEHIYMDAETLQY